VLGADCGREVSDAVHLANEIGADGRVGVHDVPLVVCERARLLQDAVGHPDLADVVQQRDLLELEQRFGAQLKPSTDREGEVDDAVGVVAGVAVAGSEGRHQRADQLGRHSRALMLLSELLLLELTADQPCDQRDELHVALIQPRARAVTDARQAAEDGAVPQLDRPGDVRADARPLGGLEVIDAQIAPRVGDEAVDPAGAQLTAVRSGELNAHADARAKGLRVAADGDNAAVATTRVRDVGHVHAQQKPHRVQGAADGAGRIIGQRRHGTQPHLGSTGGEL